MFVAFGLISTPTRLPHSPLPTAVTVSEPKVLVAAVPSWANTRWTSRMFTPVLKEAFHCIGKVALCYAAPAVYVASIGPDVVAEAGNQQGRFRPAFSDSEEAHGAGRNAFNWLVSGV